MLGLDPVVMAAGVTTLIGIIITTALVASTYHRCPPNTAMIVSGYGANGLAVRIYTVGGAVVLPILQTLNFLSLEVYPVEVNSNTPILSKDGIPLLVQGIAHIKIQSDEVSIATAAENLLGKTGEEIKYLAKQSISGHLRALAGTMSKQELIQGLDSFAHKVQEASLPALTKIGLTISSLTINELKQAREGLASEHI